MKISGKLRSRAGAVLAVLVLTGVMAGLAAPVRADDDDWRGRERREQERDRHDHDRRDWREHRRVYVKPPPEEIYSPPVVVAPPPPSGITLFFPIHIH